MNNKKALDRISEIIEQIAVKNHTTPEEVRRQIKLAMLCGMVNQDPEVQKKWREIPCEGSVPTPEEFILWATLRLEE